MRTHRSLGIALAALLLVAGSRGHAQTVGEGLPTDPERPNTRVGTRGANFLEIGIGAPALAMSGAGATLQPGVFSMYWNPAGIGHLERFGVGFSYSALYADLDINYFFAGAALPFLGGTLGAAVASLASGDIPRTTEDFPDGGDPRFGTVFEWTSSFVGLYYGRRITDRLVVGGGAKFVTEGTTGASADYVGFDGGLTFVTGLYGIQIGAAIANVGSEGRFDGRDVRRIIADDEQIFGSTRRNLEIDFTTDRLQLPTLFRFSVRVDVTGTPEALFQAPGHGLNVALDFSDANDTDLETAVGLEYNYRELIFLRAGKRFFNEDRTDAFRGFGHGLGLGAGLALPTLGGRLKLDYAFVDMGELDNIQVFSVELGL
jgi:hypothetical protein